MLLRRIIVGTCAGLLLAAGSLVPATSVDYVPWGRTAAVDQLLKPGCRHYHYRYRINPPKNDWAAELFLVGPRGGNISSAAFATGSDPAVGRETWRLCRASIVPGRYKIRMKITWRDHYDKYQGWVKPSYFRLQRQRR